MAALGKGGRPLVRVFDGVTGDRLFEFLAYPKSSRGGVFVAAADVTGTGANEIITGPGVGTKPVVNVFDREGKFLYGFLAFKEDYLSGVTVAAADLRGTAKAEIVAAQGAGPQVRAFDGSGNGGVPFFKETPYGKNCAGGVAVATVDIDGDGFSEILTRPGYRWPKGPGTLTNRFPNVGVVFNANGDLLKTLLPFSDLANGGHGGVPVAGVDLDGDGIEELLFGAGLGGPPRVRFFDFLTAAELDSFFAFDENSPTGVFVGASHRRKN